MFWLAVGGCWLLVIGLIVFVKYRWGSIDD